MSRRRRPLVAAQPRFWAPGTAASTAAKRLLLAKAFALEGFMSRVSMLRTGRCLRRLLHFVCPGAIGPRSAKPWFHPAPPFFPLRACVPLSCHGAAQVSAWRPWGCWQEAGQAHTPHSLCRAGCCCTLPSWFVPEVTSMLSGCPWL